jgi:hypothetical protein
MKNLPLVKLFLIKNRLIKEGMQGDPLMTEILNAIDEKSKMILEDGGGTSATGGAPSCGMGAVVAAQPSGLAGATIGTSWGSGGGTTGSGDVSFPYNPGQTSISGGTMDRTQVNKMQQKFPMSKNHGSRTGKKSREKKLDMKALKDVFAKKQDYTKDGEKKPKVMNFNDFIKNDITSVKK